MLVILIFSLLQQVPVMVHLDPLSNSNQPDEKHGLKQNRRRQRYAKEYETTWQNCVGPKKKIVHELESLLLRVKGSTKTIFLLRGP
jgi:hypothetical protein